MKRTIRCAHGFCRALVPCVKCDSAERSPAVAAPAIVKPIGSNYESKVTGRVYRCKVCGDRGHSKTTCANRRAADARRGVPNPNLGYRPVPAQYAETAPKRMGTR